MDHYLGETLSAALKISLGVSIIQAPVFFLHQYLVAVADHQFDAHRSHSQAVLFRHDLFKKTENRGPPSLGQQSLPLAAL